jgi:hypothetical protein
MSDERKPVICPWCGWEMVAREGQDIFHRKYNAYVCEGCEAVSPIAYSEDAAYTAATRTPPNRPLTLPELFDLDGNMDAVWVVDSGCGTIVMGAEEACEWASDADTVLFFVRKPTPADIEAARKEDDCK